LFWEFHQFISRILANSSLQALLGTPLPSLEESRSGCPKQEPADVGHVGHPTALCLRQGTHLTEQLGKKPDPDQDCGRDERHPRKPTQQQHCADSVAWIGDQEGTHNRRYGAAGPPGWGR
jgi:hypothetical protein